MPHLDEGTLHAYLDGELSADHLRFAEGKVGIGMRALDGDTLLSREDVELHLSECADCRAALEHSRRIREEASRVLSLAEPHGVSMPSFEQLQARAGERESHENLAVDNQKVAPRRNLERMRWLAWAATVVLAAAVGWYARSAVFQSERNASVSEDETSGNITIEIPQADSTNIDQDADSVARLRSVRADEARPQLNYEMTRETVGMPPAQAAATDTNLGLGAGTEVKPAAESEAPEGARPARAEGVPDTTVLREPVGVAVPIREPMAVSDREVRGVQESPQTQRVAAAPNAPTPMLTQVAGRGGTPPDGVWTSVDESTAVEILDAPVPAIAGLTVLEYATARIEGQQLVRVRQALDQSRTIDLTIFTADDIGEISADKKDAGLAPRGDEANRLRTNSLIVRRGALRILVEAAVSLDSLGVLGERIPS